MRFVATPQAESVEAFPLHWPTTRNRSKYRKRAPFHRKVVREGNQYATAVQLSISDSRNRLLKQLGMFGAKKVVISSNLRLRGDGLPISAQREPDDPGIAVYFVIKEIPHCISCDTWDRSADNLAALAKYVEAMRGQIRWGVGDVAAMFAGFRALPNAIVTAPAMTVDEAAQFFVRFGGISAQNILRNHDAYNAAYKNAARILHPDANGGKPSPQWATLQEAAKLIEQHQAGA